MLAPAAAKYKNFKAFFFHVFDLLGVQPVWDSIVDDLKVKSNYQILWYLSEGSGRAVLDISG